MPPSIKPPPVKAMLPAIITGATGVAKFAVTARLLVTFASVLGLAVEPSDQPAKKYPVAGPVLSVFPLFFAWRSLWTYFFYVTIITFAMMLMRGEGAEYLPNPSLALSFDYAQDKSLQK